MSVVIGNFVFNSSDDARAGRHSAELLSHGSAVAFSDLKTRTGLRIAENKEPDKAWARRLETLGDEAQKIEDRRKEEAAEIAREAALVAEARAKAAAEAEVTEKREATAAARKAEATRKAAERRASQQGAGGEGGEE